jgi:hypothetical protein
MSRLSTGLIWLIAVAAVVGGVEIYQWRQAAADLVEAREYACRALHRIEAISDEQDARCRTDDEVVRRGVDAGAVIAGKMMAGIMSDTIADLDRHRETLNVEAFTAPSEAEIRREIERMERFGSGYRLPEDRVVIDATIAWTDEAEIGEFGITPKALNFYVAGETVSAEISTSLYRALQPIERFCAFTSLSEPRCKGRVFLTQSRDPLFEETGFGHPDLEALSVALEPMTEDEIVEVMRFRLSWTEAGEPMIIDERGLRNLSSVILNIEYPGM